MTDQDQTCTCKDCSVEFVFTAGERKFYETNGFQPPKRCKACRMKRKAAREGASTEADTQNFKKGGRRDDRDDRY